MGLWIGFLILLWIECLFFILGQEKIFSKKSEQMFAFFGKMCYTDFVEHLFICFM